MTTSKGLALWLIASSCGGIAVIDGTDGGAGGASGAQSSTDASTQSSSSAASTTSTGSGAVNPLCTAACALIDQCLTNPSDCVAACSDENCATAHDALLSCLLDEQNPDFLCGLPDPCIIRVQQYTNCLGSGVFTGQCPVATCECLYSDQRGNTLQSKCTSQGCECSLNGALMGTCKSHDPGCDPLLDCCATMFFVASPLK